MIENQRHKDYFVFDNLRGSGWQKKERVGDSSVDGIVLTTKTKRSTHFKFDPTIYQLPDESYTPKSTNRSGKKMKGVCTGAYLNGIVKSKSGRMRNDNGHSIKTTGLHKMPGTVASAKSGSHERHSGSAANGGYSTDDSKRKHKGPSNSTQTSAAAANFDVHQRRTDKQHEDKTNLHQQDAPIQSEHTDKKAKIDVDMKRESPAAIAVISLFDGVSSVLPVITETLGGQPTIFVGAECDQTLRHLVAEKHGFRLDGQWRKHPSGMSSIYIDDIKKLFVDGCKILSQIVCMAGPECKGIFVSGSPCQDLTIAGPTGGVVGLCGKQSCNLVYSNEISCWLC